MMRAEDQLADCAEIREVVHVYAHAFDRHDKALLLSCFHHDATFQVNNHAPVSAQAMFEAVPLIDDGLHHIINQLITLHGDEADSECALIAYQAVPADAPARLPLFRPKAETYGMMLGARYFDRLAKRDGAWRILRRRLVFDWHYDVEASAIPLAPFEARDGGFGERLRRARL